MVSASKVVHQKARKRTVTPCTTQHRTVTQASFLHSTIIQAAQESSFHQPPLEASRSHSTMATSQGLPREIKITRTSSWPCILSLRCQAHHQAHTLTSCLAIAACRYFILRSPIAWGTQAATLQVAQTPSISASVCRTRSNRSKMTARKMEAPFVNRKTKRSELFSKKVLMKMHRSNVRLVRILNTRREQIVR